jgi:outer membrane protein OmpA-like peptidoglycan-associated protein
VYKLSGGGSIAASGHTITSYLWAIGGQTVGTGQTLTYSFPSTGVSYPITLTVTDDQGVSTSTVLAFTPHQHSVRVRRVVHFGLDRAALTATAHKILRPLRPLIAYASTVRLDGYCANRETSRHLLLVKLSRLRAQTVWKFLVHGDRHPRPTVRLNAHAATGFIARNTTAAGRARNRRVTIAFTYVKPST